MVMWFWCGCVVWQCGVVGGELFVLFLENHSQNNKLATPSHIIITHNHWIFTMSSQSAGPQKENKQGSKYGITIVAWCSSAVVARRIKKPTNYYTTHNREKGTT